MTEKLKQALLHYPMTALVVLMTFLACGFLPLSIFNKLALLVIVWWVGFEFERPINKMIQQKKLNSYAGRVFCLVVTLVFASVLAYVQIRFA